MSTEHEEEQRSMRVVDKRRFTLNKDGSVAEHPEVVKEPPMKPKTEPAADPSAKQSKPAPAVGGPALDADSMAADSGGAAHGEKEPPKQTEGMPFAHFLQQQAYLAMIYLGQQPHPATGLVQAQPEGAREIIDVLLMLRSRTKGNLNRDESFALNDLLHQLQLVYLKATGGGPVGGLPPPPGEKR